MAFCISGIRLLVNILCRHGMLIAQRLNGSTLNLNGSIRRQLADGLSRLDVKVYFNLSGLWFGQVLSLHLSGIVLVPSIISDPQRLQILPVGFALMANLHSG